ncbi:MAG: CoA transferase, partial [Hyphomicrobiaceae bacterium]|nr:CoA transferase [Hyphomicrobiaceae bacterium]
TEGQWATLCDVLGLPELKADPRLQTKMDTINARSWTIPLVAEKVAAREFDDLVAEFEQHGLSFSAIAKPSDMFEDPHVMRPGGLATSMLPDGRSFRAPSLPFEVDGTMVTGGGDLAAVGQHTDEVLGALGLNPATIAAARGKKKA